MISMIRRTQIGAVALLVAALPMIGCGDNQGAPAAPGSMPAGLLGANPDGSTLKVTAPAHVSPTNFFELENLTPVFRFTPAQGRHVAVALAHQVDVLTEAGALVQTLNVPAGATQVTYPGNLEMARVYQWRVRAAFQGHVGPSTGLATFRTRSVPLVTPETLNDYLFEFAGGNGAGEWNACAAGSGTACFRFVWDLVESINPTCDPNSWGLLSKNPGEWQCTRSHCGNLSGEGFGEDIVTHGGFSPILLWDVIVSAGAPGAQLGASPIPRDDRRPGNNWACPWGN
jgi:hypothetical protein